MFENQERVRAEAIRVGRIPKFKAGAVVWVLCGEVWCQGVVTRRLPGDVYLTRVVRPWCATQEWIVSANTYGGVV